MASRLIKLQTAVFTRDLNLNDEYKKSHFLLTLKENLGALFNGEPLIFPGGFDDAPDYPRIIMTSKDNVFSANIALTRTDIFYNIPADETQNIEELLSIQRNNISLFIKSLENVSVVRIGFVAYAEHIIDDENATKYIIRKFFKEDKFDEPKELLFRYIQNSKLESIEFNNVITTSGNRASKKINLVVDINTNPEQSNRVDLNIFEKIINYTSERAKAYIEGFPNTAI